jgi:hypothetical protein
MMTITNPRNRSIEEIRLVGFLAVICISLFYHDMEKQTTRSSSDRVVCGKSTS